jgi:hypothetical protein
MEACFEHALGDWIAWRTHVYRLNSSIAPLTEQNGTVEPSLLSMLERVRYYIVHQQTFRTCLSVGYLTTLCKVQDYVTSMLHREGLWRLHHVTYVLRNVHTVQCSLL